ncbi:MAG: GNAT family N-acetyltransferase [Lachnospiraceae bacterium]|nr:GNAT family N-acetyltransferase [Lachnospiraceae bacterium]
MAFIRKVEEQDKQVYMELVDQFYHSEAVLHPVEKEHYEITWKELMRSNDYLECFFIEKEGKTAGFLLLSYSFSQESGGKIAWIEEIYIQPEYQGQGLGKEFFRFIEENIEPKVTRIRLEIEPDNDGARRLYQSMGYKELPYEQMVKELFLKKVWKNGKTML